ncbi:hypothetical protein [Roseinatronobacter bogoriensis]|uniref:DUF1127 domain-containing protein n=1 Tax=Roseinatronobacter bogoriensis subsp. barguzinensis TaxID=441209 RepID=A0A2K8K9M9_9RHOB|nr:hypothetical protein [Rhodobaca]ATX66162.1 hypothetical protein BG454_10315 [Rhodobaca barguzinensis]MBB4207199.1 uncharacterized protein YjiS (DUF1127 family) [Rhodobaca bogoriensis DSM 18756]TDW40432.1 hypothetical protein LY39_01470 [Rhodobaca barguzinensis]TDY70416.1 hypothetical protein EV660_10287 [Rhodobaca bogoriensis DSM 18756]
MTTLTTNIRNTARPNLRQIGDSILNALVRIAEFSPKYRAVMHFNAMSDAELAKLGLTRAEVVDRIFGARTGL